MSKYNILYSLEKKLYLESSPVLLEAGALVSNTESGKLHIQLKLKNLSSTNISMVKAEFVLMDAVGREIGRGEKQYIDLNTKVNEYFADKDPVFLKDNTVRKFSAAIKEVCFLNGDIWTAPENAIWEKIPNAQSITQKITTSEALDEFKNFYCKEAKFVPFVYKDVWICSCGNVNKNSREKCPACAANFSKMDSVDSETLKKTNIYRKATELVNKSDSSEIKKGIALFERIPDWKDSAKKLEEAKQKVTVVLQNEKDAQEKTAKRKKKNIIIAAISCAAVAVLMIGISIGSSISKANQYEQAQEYMSQDKYSEAMDLLDGLKGYKNADELYQRAWCMYYNDYGGIVKMDNLTEFVIPEGVTKIADGAFSFCSNLKSVTIPDSVTSISKNAFSWCSSLESVTIGGGVKSIGENAFYKCDSLKSITIPNGVTSIGENAFYKCDSLKGITIPNGVTSIGEDAFKDCSSLTSVTCPAFAVSYIPKSKLETVVITSGKTIADDAFSWCSSLESITIGDSVTSIGDDAFSWCSSLESITIGDSVTSIGDDAFYYCSSLTSITIPNSVTYIGDSAFNGCSKLTSVTLPNSVTSLGDSAFYNCRGLTSVVIGDSVKSIGDSAFSSCYELTSIIIPNSVTSLGDSAFSGCDSLTSITIPDSVTSIGDSAFSGCSGLTSITISDSVTSIGNDAFYNCKALTNINYNATECADLSSGNDVFYNAGQSGTGITVTIGAKVKKMPAYLFCPYSRSNSYAPKITMVIFEEGSVCESIGNDAFEDCISLTSITIPDSVTYIGDDAFAGCYDLAYNEKGNLKYLGNASNPYLYLADVKNRSIKSATIENTCKFIGEGAFYNCNLTSITIPDSVTSIGSSAFEDCNSLTSIVIPDSVTYIGNDAFFSCSRLTSVTIPDSVTYIGDDAFDVCYDLAYNEKGNLKYLGNASNPYLYLADVKDASITSATIENTCKFIGEGAFSGCSKLTSITLPNSVISIGDSAFSGCRSLTSITIPDSVTSIGNDAFYNCSSLTSITFNGTKAQWNAIEKGSSWKYNVPATEVVCTDGRVSL